MINRLLCCVTGLVMSSHSMAAGCLVSNFKGAVISINIEARRAEAAYDWLKAEVESCSVEKLTIIRNNSPSWLGTALNPQIEALIEAAIEAKASEDPELLKKLFETKIARPADPSPTMSGSSSDSPAPLLALKAARWGQMSFQEIVQAESEEGVEMANLLSFLGHSK